MIQMKDMLELFPKMPLYYNIPSKHAQEKCLNADFLGAGRLFQKKCLVVYYSSSKPLFSNGYYERPCIDKDTARPNVRPLIPTLPPGSASLPTTGELLATDPRFSTLLVALSAAFGEETGLVAPFTVFAPTNAAFAKIDNATLTGLLADTDALQTGEKQSSSSYRSVGIRMG